jgi:hypothetical protein
MRCLLPAMPVVTLAGPEGDSMGNPLERRRLFEANSSSAGDPDDGADPLLVGEAPPEDAPVEDEESFELDESDIEEFLAGHNLTEEQHALLELFLSGTGDPATVWASLVSSLTNAFLAYVMDETDSETDSG